MIYLLRHGETFLNNEGRFQGKCDSPLTDRGIAQACHSGRRLALEISGREDLFELQVSPCGRTKETAARIVQAVSLPVKYEPELQEVSLGSWDGMSLYEIGQEYPTALQGITAFDWFFRSPDGETLEHAYERAKSWLAGVRRPTIAISHGLIGRLIRGAYLGLPQDAALALPIPQHGFHLLYEGRIEFIE